MLKLFQLTKFFRARYANRFCSGLADIYEYVILVQLHSGKTFFFTTFGWQSRVVLSVDEVTAYANEVTDKAGFIGRENVACLYRELG